MASIVRAAIKRLEHQLSESQQTALIDFSITYHRQKPSGNCDGHPTKLDTGGWFFNGNEEPPGWYLYQRCKICGKGFKHGPVERPAHI